MLICPKLSIMKTFFPLLALICLQFTILSASPTNNGDQPTYIQTVAEKGDGVFSLLRKYQLETNECNRSQFYTLNGLEANAQLHIGKSYKLPIMVYNYNSKSIRSTIGVDDWDLAVSIKAYNEKLVAIRINKESYTKSKKLWVPYNMLHCISNNNEASKAVATSVQTGTSNTPPVPKVEKKEDANFLIEPLFGKNNQSVAVKDLSLKNKVFYLVSGHGGIDPGTTCETCPTMMCEDEYAYDVTLRLARNLMQRGATVHVIIQDKNDGIRSEKYLKCDHDENSMGKFKIPNNQLRRLEQRSKNINELYKKYKKKGIKDQYAIMIHIDARTKDKRIDTFFYYYEHGRTSKSLALHMQNTFKNKYNYYQKGRGYKGFVASRNLYMIRNTLPTALYVELGNIKNSSDQKRFILPENRQFLADWLFDGLNTFQD